VRGSDALAARLEELLARENVAHRVEMIGSFCMEECSRGVSVRVGDRQYREIRPENAESFFSSEILPLIAAEESK
jgi:NADH:ubiquinone oxidoreductase subunit E